MKKMAIIKLVNDKQLWLVKKLQSVTLFILILLIVSFRSQITYADCVYQSPRSESYGALVKSFKVMTINVYGQQGVMPFNDGACQDRLREIGEHIRDVREPYDIVGLQEWHTDTASTCNGVVLKNRIDDIYPVSGVSVGEHTMDHYQWAHPKAYDQNDGGLGIVSKTQFLWDKYSEDDFGSFWDEDPTETENVHQFTPRFNNTVTAPFYWKIARTAHGFLFARIFLSRNPDIAVDTYVVHLTSTGSKGVGRNKCDLECKQGMLDQLREGIHQRSADSGFPVLVMGDFNIGGPFDTTDPSIPCAGNDGYGDIMRNLGNPKDLWLEGSSTLNGEEGYTHISSENRKKMRIDFMFVPSDPYLVNSPYEITHKNPRKIDHVQLSNSDHKSIIAELDIRQKTNPTPTNPTPTISLSNSKISFGSVAQKDVRTRVLKISNHGLANLSISIDPSPPPPQGQPKSGFFWNSLSTLIPPRQSRNFVVYFSPRAKGRFEETLLITSNSTGSPHNVRLSGRGLKNNNTNNQQGSGGDTNNSRQPL